jgi:hypothetical protein
MKTFVERGFYLQLYEVFENGKFPGFSRFPEIKREIPPSSRFPKTGGIEKLYSLVSSLLSQIKLPESENFATKHYYF